jgi:quinohemoprotein ethanol dehydrogenase
VVPAPPPPEASADTVARGELVYGQHCLICHGLRAISGGSIPDLRMMTPETHAQFEAIVLEGIRGPLGMVAFADLLSRDDARAVHAYVIKRANEDFAGAAGSAEP